MHLPTPGTLPKARFLLMNETKRVPLTPPNTDRILRSGWLHHTVAGGGAVGAILSLR